MKLAAIGLACRRADRLVFDGLSFSLGAGDALVVTGRNGAGKSTLLAAIAGQLRPAAGRIEATGIGERPLPECLHLVAHRDGLKSALTAEENLALARDLLGDPLQPPREALASFGLAHAGALPVAYLSAGQRRRVALARLLVSRRPLWLLDEPAASLDVAAQALLAREIARHRASGGLVIAVTHAPMDIPGAQALRIEAPTQADAEHAAGLS